MFQKKFNQIEPIKKRQRWLAAVLTVCMMATMLPASGWAEGERIPGSEPGPVCLCNVRCTADTVDTACSLCSGEEEGWTACQGTASDSVPNADDLIITAWDVLDEAIASQSVAAGVRQEDLTLPETLTATGAEALTVAGVSWTSEPAYDGAVPGRYTFVPVLPPGYSAVDGLSLPQITVTVDSDAVNALSNAIDALPTADDLYANAPGEDDPAFSDWLAQTQSQLATVPALWAQFLALSEDITAMERITEIRAEKLAGLNNLAERLGERETLGETAITTVDALNTAISSSTGTLDAPAVITIAAGGITVDSAIIIEGKHIKLTGGTLTRGDSYASNLIEVKNGGSLTLENITLNGNSGKASGGCLLNLNNAALFLENGAVLTNNPDTAINIGYHFSGSSSVTINGGTISNNAAKENGGAIKDTDEKTVITIKDGKITGNTANGTDATSTYGGAIYSNGALIIAGGEITGNSTTGRGGGIFKTGGTDKVFTVTGGTISGNSAQTGDNVYINQCAFTLGGAANIPDGLYLKLGSGKSTFAIASALENLVKIEAIDNNPQVGDLVASGATGEAPYTITDSDLAKFSYADNTYSFVLENNQIKLAAPKFVASQPEVDNTYPVIYANGTALLLVAGSSTATNTVVYIDNDKNGTVTEGDTIFDPDGDSGAMNGTTTGNDLSAYFIYGGKKDTALTGDTKITMTGGKVKRIYGGGSSGSSLTGDTYITVSGGEVSYDIYGGGDSANVTGKTDITVSGGTVGHEIYGGGGNNSSVASSTVTIGGNAQVGGSSLSGPLYGIVINGGTNVAVKNGLAQFVIGQNFTGSVNVKLPKGFDVISNPVIATGAAEGDAAKIALSGAADGLEAYFDSNAQAIKVRKPPTPTSWSDDGVRAEAFQDGDGSEEKPYQIATPAELGYMDYLINNDWNNYKNKHYKLTADIDLSGNLWMPIGSSGAFMGTFDGGNFTITNMQIQLDSDDATDRFAGLFGRVYNGTVKNVTVGTGSKVAANYTGGTFPIGYGGVVGDAYGASTIENCHSSASVNAAFTNDSGYGCVGGIVGYLEKGTVKNCSNSGTITVDGISSYAGGVVGYNSNTEGKVGNCYNTGNIEGKKDWSYYGGVAGANNGTIENCYSCGILILPNSKEMSAGGLVGDNADFDGGKAVNSYWRKDVGVNETLSAVGSPGTETNVFSFNNNGALSGSVTISGKSYASLLSALNAWVDAQSTDYWFWTGDAASPRLTKDAPPATYVVTVNVNKDGTAWTSHGKTFKLVSGKATVTNLNAVENGTYDLYEGDSDTGADVTVNSATASVTVDYYTVTFYDGSVPYVSGIAQAPQIVLKNAKAAKPANPIKADYIFTKWVTANGGDSEFDFTNTAITGATNVYASWNADPSTAVNVALKMSKNAPYYNGDSLILTAEVTNRSTQAVVTTGTVQFYKGDEKLGDAVRHSSENGFASSVICGTSLNFPFLAIGENEVKAVYTSASGAVTESSATTTLEVSNLKDGNSYVGANVIDTSYNGSPDGNCPVQFTISNNGKDKGITTEQLTITGKKDDVNFSDYTVTHNDEKTVLSIYVKTSGTYTFKAILNNANYAAEETAQGTVSLAQMTIAPKDVTIAAGEAPVFSYTANGLKGTDRITNVTYTTTAGGDYSKPGIYDISISDITMDNLDCYTISKGEKAKLTITDREIYPLTVNGGSGSGDYAKGAEITVTADAPEGGKRFKAWMAEGITLADATANPVTLTMPAGAVTLTAIYEDVYTITFDANGGNALTPAAAQTGRYGRLSMLPIPSRSGYYFDGWYTAPSGGAVVTADYVFTGDSTIYAQWSAATTSDGSDSGSGSAPGVTSPIVMMPPASTPDAPTTVQLQLLAKVDNEGTAVVTLDSTTLESAILAAQTAAERSDSTQNGIALEIHVLAAFYSTAADTVTVNLPKVTQERLIEAQVSQFTVVVDQPDIAISLNLDSIKAVHTQANADVQLSAAQLADTAELSTAARAVIGDRPVFQLMADYPGGKVTDFGQGNVRVEIPYTLRPGERASGLYAVYVDESGQLHYLVDSYYDVQRGLLCFVTNHFSIYGIGYRETPVFIDIEGHWAKADIDFVASRGLMCGVSRMIFAPDEAMTRGMLVTVLGRQAGIDPADYAGSTFKDVPETAYYAPYVYWAANVGIAQGTANDTFSPDQVLTRQEAAVLLTNYANVLGDSLPHNWPKAAFADAAVIEEWASQSAAQMQQAGIIAGKDGNRFDPLAKATRGEMAAMLKRYVMQTR